MVLVELVIGLTALAVTGLATRLPPRGSMAVDSEAFPFGHRAALGATSRIVRHEPFSKRQRRRREIWRRLRSAEAFRFCAKGCAPGSWSSSVLPPRWSPRRSTLDSEVGASALAEGSNPIPPDSGLSKARPSERERGGEQGRAKTPDGRTPSTGYHHSPRPPAEAPASSRLTGILGCLSHLRHRASDRVFAVCPPHEGRSACPLVHASGRAGR
jgi:hypothetical protein